MKALDAAKPLLRLARSRLGGRIIGWLFAKMNFALPVERLYETEQVMAFSHPSPIYPLHVLIVPKRSICSLAEIDPSDASILSDVLQAAQELIHRFHLEDKGYRLIVNGGAYQDVAQLHFHLVSDQVVNEAEYVKRETY